MRKKFLLVLLMLAMSVFLSPVPGQSGPASDFIAVLDGQSQVPSRETPATGKVVFNFNEAERKIQYKLTATNIENVVGSHIHLGKPGKNGPIVADLAGPFPPGKGQKDGVLAEGAFAASHLLGPLRAVARGSQHEEDDDLLLAQLLAAMQTGEAYVDIHTDLGWAPAGHRPGNFPEGEIRGQIRTASE
ncbi:MAG: CHRD domain-containing protein [Nitrospira sp.]|nr:CHRD domain-containing protein [Nitrospira sp.]